MEKCQEHVNNISPQPAASSERTFSRLRTSLVFDNFSRVVRGSAGKPTMIPHQSLLAQRPQYYSAYESTVPRALQSIIGRVLTTRFTILPPVSYAFPYINFPFSRYLLQAFRLPSSSRRDQAGQLRGVVRVVHILYSNHASRNRQAQWSGHCRDRQLSVRGGKCLCKPSDFVSSLPSELLYSLKSTMLIISVSTRLSEEIDFEPRHAHHCLWVERNCLIL